VLGADTQSYTLTGIDAGFARTWGIAADTQSYALTGIDVTLSTTGTVTPTPSTQQQSGGVPKRRRERKYQVEIDGEVFNVASPEEAQELLHEAEEVAREQAETVAERAANAPKRQRRKRLADAARTLKVPEVRVEDAEIDEGAAAIQAQAQAFIERVNAMFADTMRAIEIGALLQRRLDDDEEEVAELLLLSL
jgi:hypothetical protein